MIRMLTALLLVLLGGPLQANQDPYAGVDADDLRGFEYTDRTLAMAERLPVQDGGRIKPLSTLAGFQLLRHAGRRGVEVSLPGAGPGETRRLTPTEWMLDTLFFPRQAERYRLFTVADDAVLTAVGLEFEGRKRRDRYSYYELLPGRQRMMELAGEISAIEAKQRSSTERQLLRLATSVRDYEDLLGAFAFARTDLDLARTPFLERTFAGRPMGVTTLFAHLDPLRDRWDAAERGELDADVAEAELAAAAAIQNGFGLATELARLGPGLLPPLSTAVERDAWLDAGEVLLMAASEGDSEGALPLLGVLEDAEAAKGDPESFEQALATFSAGVLERAEARGEYEKIPLEVDFYAWDFFFRALLAFLLGFVLVAVGWLRSALAADGRSRLLWGAAWTSTSVGLVLLVAGITVRCVLRERPPVSTLYETILFITAGIVAVSLFVEYLLRQRVAIGLAAALGVLGMFLGQRYEFREALSSGDTMTSLQAVLDTNFWLATHVTTVTLGYAAGLLAAFIAMVWLACRLLGVRSGDESFYAGLTRALYGVLCFGLLLSTVGTILGGVWANDSWGRFWGWDPKENGALMIVLWELVILHARLGGYVRQFGLQMLSIALGPVVAFSWWHVNLLGVGLHSYGFTDGVLGTLTSFYLLSVLAIGAGLVWYRAVGPDVANGRRRPIAASEDDSSGGA
jgi:ABC-type transport system involved in cytochrome c biogenesis permease subunit